MFKMFNLAFNLSQVDVAVEHCKAQKFNMVELITSEHHEKARSLYYKKGFELIGSYQKRFVGGMIGLNMYKLSKKVNEKPIHVEDDD